MAKEIFVRLKPFAPKRGYKAQRYSYKGQVYVGGTRPNWYQVSQELADDLKEHQQIHDDPDSKPLFDIVDGDKKREIEEQEQGAFLAGLGYGAATVAPPHNLPQPHTTDIRTDEEKEADKPVMPDTPPAPAAGGRAAAVPKPKTSGRRGGSRGETKTAAVTMGDLKDGDGEGEG